MTKVEAITKVMQDNDGLASWYLIYANIERYYPSVKQPKEWQAAIRGVLYREVGKKFKKLDNGLFALLDFNEAHYLENSATTTTEASSTIQTRIGQQFFRKSLLKALKQCPFTRVNFQKLLIASHIKPWKDSDDTEKLDVNNGLLLTPTYDKLFDGGYISFSNNKALMVSSRLDIVTQQLLNLKNGNLVSNFPISGRAHYLEYHRDVVFNAQ